MPVLRRRGSFVCRHFILMIARCLHGLNLSPMKSSLSALMCNCPLITLVISFIAIQSTSLNHLSPNRTIRQGNDTFPSRRGRINWGDDALSSNRSGNLGVSGGGTDRVDLAELFEDFLRREPVKFHNFVPRFVAAHQFDKTTCAVKLFSHQFN